MIERQSLLCYMLGWIESAKRPIKRNDSLILLDQILLKMCQPTVKQTELDYFQDLDDEMGFGLIQMGIGRERAKEIARKGIL